MPKCKRIGCANEVDTFYYCDDHFEEGEGVRYTPEKTINDLKRERDESEIQG